MIGVDQTVVHGFIEVLMYGYGDLRCRAVESGALNLGD